MADQSKATRTQSFFQGMQFRRSKRGEEAMRGRFACQLLSGYFGFKS
jgi:hypothetical protein